MANKAMAQPIDAEQAPRQASNIVHLDPVALIAKAIEHAVPVETLERLLAMRAAIAQESARSAFFTAMARFQAQIPPIQKRQVAKVQTKGGANFTYHYADLGDIVTAIRAPLAACELSLSFDTALKDGMLTVIASVHHAQGHSSSSTFAVPLDREARMSPSQAMGSALTYARRYAMCAALGIVTAEDDDDAQTTQPAPRTADRRPPQGQAPATAPTTARPTAAAPTPAAAGGAPQQITEAQHKRLEARIHELGLDRQRVKDWVHRAWAVEHLNLIPAVKYDELDRRLDTWADAARVTPTQEQDEERAAIQSETTEKPIEYAADQEWFADYDRAAD